MASDKLLIAALRSQWYRSNFEEKCEEAGLSFDNYEGADILLDAIFDELGVPEDETCDVPYEEIPNVFCRDWLYDLLDSFIKTGTEEECMNFINQVRKDVAEIRAEMN